MRIQHNINALNSQRQLGVNNTAVGKNLEKLSSGYRINRAGDDAAGLAISEKMRSQIGGLDQAQQNAQDGISLIQTAEGGLNETHAILQKMRKLAVQSSNGTYVTGDRTQLDLEFQQLKSEITRIADQTEFNTQKLLNGTSTFSFQVGSGTGQAIDIVMQNMTAGVLGLTASSVSGNDNTASQAAITSLDAAIASVSGFRATLGSVQNRLEHTISNLGVTTENITAAESRIRDVDMAKEMMEYTKNNILTQAAQAMLAQANQQPQGILQLLQ